MFILLSATINGILKYANSLVPDQTPSNSASDPGSSYFTLAEQFYKYCTNLVNLKKADESLNRRQFSMQAVFPWAAEGGEDDMEVPVNVSFPLMGIGVFTLILSLAFCCYMWKLKRDARTERGYKRIYFSPQNKKKNPNDTCPVCLDEFRVKEKVVICPCKHVFHTKCLLLWLQQKNCCPMCKAPVRQIDPENAFIAQETTRLMQAISNQAAGPSRDTERSRTETV